MEKYLKKKNIKKTSHKHHSRRNFVHATSQFDLDCLCIRINIVTQRRQQPNTCNDRCHYVWRCAIVFWIFKCALAFKGKTVQKIQLCGSTRTTTYTQSHTQYSGATDSVRFFFPYFAVSLALTHTHTLSISEWDSFFVEMNILIQL